MEDPINTFGLVEEDETKLSDLNPDLLRDDLPELAYKLEEHLKDNRDE